MGLMACCVGKKYLMQIVRRSDVKRWLTFMGSRVSLFRAG